MKTYKVPPESPYKRLFYIFIAVPILTLLAACVISRYDLLGVRDADRRALGCTAVVIMCLCFWILAVLTAKEKMWVEKKKGLTFELSDEKIVELRNGTVVKELSREEINVVGEFWGWLFIKGAQPSTGMQIPKETIDYEELKAAIAPDAPVLTLGRKPYLLQVLIVAALLGACFLLFTTRSPVVLFSAAAALVGSQIWLVFFLKRLSKRRPLSPLMPLFYIGFIPVILWIVYTRSKLLH
jgi:hypothetical protein